MGARTVTDSGAHRAALRHLDTARRRRRLEELEWFDAFYRVYVCAFLAVLALVLLSGVIGDVRVGVTQLARVQERGPTLIALLASAALAISVRVGGHGGPVTLEPAFVQQVLLAPVDRGVALRVAALHKLRSAAFVGAAFAAGAGVFAARQLPGGVARWASAGAVTGATVAVLAVDVALLAATSTARRTLLRLAVAASFIWCVADLSRRSNTSPLSVIGRLGLLPITHRPLSLLATGAVLALTAAVLNETRHLPLEAAARRTRLAAVLRFSVTLGDVRAVVLLQRELAEERPRSRPWVRFTTRDVTRRSVWRRGWRGALRWPASRVLRLMTLSLASGGALVGFWHGATPLLIVSGFVSWLVGLEVTEAVSQEIDHSDFVDALPRSKGPHLVRHVPMSLVAAIVPAVVALAVVGVAEHRANLLPVLAATALSMAAAAMGAGMLTAVRELQALFTPTALSSPEIAGPRYVQRALTPPALAAVGLLPLAVARIDRNRSGQAVLLALFLAVLLSSGTAAWLRFREPARDWLEHRSPLRWIWGNA